MKPTHGDVTSSQSCSCTSCTYKSESERPSLKQIVSQGSKVDKLYLGQYIPLRERKLIGKLVRTRAVYDDIRNQLVSESSLSISEKADLRQKNNYPRRDKEIVDAAKNSAILELVNLVDRGAVLGSRRLSECCSCCGCGSITQHEHQGRGHTHRHGWPHISSRSSMTSARRAKDERLKGRPHKAKLISSDPCTCTAKFSGLSRTESKSLIKKIRGKKSMPSYKPPFETFEDNRMKTRRKVRGFNFKQTGMGESVRRSLTKVKQSSTRISRRVKMGTKKSLETIQKTQEIVKGKIKDSAKKTVNKVKPVIQQKEMLSEEKIVANAIRDSLTIYKEGLKFDPSFWECNFECDPEQCEPEECYKKKEKKLKNIDAGRTEATRSSNKADAEIQGVKIGPVAATETIERNEAETNDEMDKTIHNETRKKIKNKNAQIQDNCFCKSTESKTFLQTKSVKSNTSVLQNTESKTKQLKNPVLSSLSTKPNERRVLKKGSAFGFSFEAYKDKPTRSTNLEEKKVDKLLYKKRGHQRHRRSSSTSQSTKRSNRSGGLPLKRCFCTLKLKPHKNKPNLNKMYPNYMKPTVSKRLQTPKSRQGPVLLPYECEPMVCVPDECDPVECLKLIRERGLHHSTITTNKTHYNTKSTSSLASKSVSSGSSENTKTQKTTKRDNTGPFQQINERPLDQSKQYHEPNTARQAVRISSNFSFNIEFYKDKGDHVNSNSKGTLPSLNMAIKGTNKKQVRHLTNQPSQISRSGKSKYTLTKHKLRRCFCTLKFAKAGQQKYKIKSHSRGTLTSGQSVITPVPVLVDRATEKRDRKNIKKYTLLPYECEPGICVPGECNPYKCLEIIERRKTKTYTRQSGTDQRKTKSTYSITRRKPITSAKSVNVESITSRQNNENVNSKRRPAHIETTSLTGAPNKQMIRIGSNFSFNVEFYKEKSPTREKPVNKLDPKNVGIKTIVRSKKSQGYTLTKQQKSSSVQSTTKKKEALSQSNIKRCFCTLKLHKIAKRKIQESTTGTDTTIIKENVYPKMKTATKSTKMKKTPNVRLLEPYECEPNFCSPGQCDPYICLERIKVRDKVKSREFGTLTNTMKRVSVSSTSGTYKKNKDALSQSFYKAKQIHNTPSRINYTPSVHNSEASTERHKGTSRQATRIGSNFSFNIEFSKERSLKTHDIKEYENVRPKILRKRGDNFPGAMHAKQNDSQTSDIKKITKSTGLRPILKKCFCTRKLQKLSPTVMPVLVQNSFTTFYRKEWIRLRNLLSKQILKTYASSTSTMFSSTCTESSLSTTHKDLKKYQQSRINKYGLVISSTSFTKLNKETVIGMNRYLKSSFYAMNLQVQNQQKYKHKLEPYECEPGICIPGQCDPVKCQKLIMKRLMKKVSTMTSMNRRSQAVSSGALHSKSRKQQYNRAPTANAKPKLEKEHQGIKYKTLPRTHKQAVRVGSSFSFNIEFFKDRTATKQPPQETISRVKRDKGETSSTNTNFKKGESRSTSGKQVLQQHRTSQSGTATHDKGFNVTPKTKRCFCTLKIQKKGRQSKAIEDKITKRVEHKFDVVKTADAGQNTKNIKPYRLFDLDPNECEPNFCVPGECDPYACLERIKKRAQRRNTKDFGTDMKPRKMTTSSMTSSQKQATKAKQAYVKEKTSKPAIIKPVAPMEIQYTKPSRQVVRIGSNFSFDIEFFKDQSFPGEANIPTMLPSKAVEHKQVKSQKAGKDKNLKQISIQDSKAMRHQDSQVVLPTQHEKSTKTGSLMQRCFCTLNLRKQTKSHKKEMETVGNYSKNQRTSSSFIEKCLCALKFLAKAKHKNKEAKTAAQTEPRKVETSSSAQTKKVKEKRQVRKIKLDPNECEPGICVPGECDPLICIKRIRKRNALDKISSTEASGTRSTATLSKSPKVSKSTASNAYTQNKNKTSKPEVKRRSQSVKRTKSSERSAVRIGSNFNFSIEFYKEKNPTYQQVQSAVKKIKQSRVAATESSKLISARAKGIDNAVVLLNRDSQVDHIKKEDKASDVGMLKRCFCTLALQKRPVTPTAGGANLPKGQKRAKIKQGKNDKQKGVKIKISTKGTETPDKNIKKLREYKSNPYKLEPYECEPGICVPGKCNPYECEKLIKKRQRRESGTETLQQTSKSATTITKTGAKKNHKVQNVQAINRYKRSTASKQHAPVKRVSISSKGHARQAVKIGSNFSFNIEFSKSMTGNVNKIDDVISKPVKKRTHNDTQSQSSNYRHQKTQGTKDVHHAYSQVLARKVRSTVTEVAPMLKRCFCTLKLMNEKLPKEKVKMVQPIPKNIKPTKSIPSQVNKVINTDKPKNKPFRTLDPNECEPGICIPGKCDPHECLKRIKKRMHSKMSNTDAVRGQKTSSATTKPEYSSAKTTTAMYQHPASRETGDYKKPEKKRPSLSPTTIQQGNRQVVRIGSNFSFNIEFFKDTSHNNGMGSPKPERIPKISQQKIQSDSHSQSNAASGGYQRKLVDRQLQSLGLSTESRGSGVGPLMKRCFCTLKLQKVGKTHQKVPEPVNKKKDNAASARIKVKVDDSRISRNVGTRTKKKHRVLDPNECEPNTCIPGQCNPLECLERIKLRNLNEFGTDAIRTSMKSTSSLTDGKGQLKTIQTPPQKTAVTKPYDEPKRKPDGVSYSHTAEDQNRQSVRLGSSFNFNIEFFKESSQNKEPIKNVKYETPSMINTNRKLRTKPIGTKSQGSLNQSLSSHHRGQQARVLQESVGSGITPLLKRCFCTLTLHNTETNKITCPKSRKTPVHCTCKNKSTSTKKLKEIKYNIPDDLNPNECEPGVCIPGQCNPYECLERIKKRGIRRQSRTASTNQRRFHNKACAAFGSIGQSKQMQSEDTPIQRVVEQPRFPFMDRNNWQGVKIGSNIHFNIEFYKETVLPEAEANDSAKKHYSKRINKSMRQSMVYNETTDAKYMRDLQKVETEDKTSVAKNASKALRKYLCSSRCQQNKQCEKYLTTGRVDKVITRSPFKPTRYYVYQVKQIRHACSDDFVEKELKFVSTLKTKTQAPEDIKTILPYKPRKYCKNGSNTLFSRKCIAKGAEYYFCSCRTYQGQRCKEENAFDIRKLSCREISKHIRLTCKEKIMILPHKSTVTALKKFFCSQFTKFRNDVKQMDPYNRDIISLESNSDQLKKCKSDRSPIKCPLSQPKKSKSCKTTVIENRKYNMLQFKKCFSGLQSGDAMSSKTISVSGCQKCFVEESIHCKLSKSRKRKMTQSKHFIKTTNYSLPAQTKTKLNDSPNPGILIECVRKLSKCKEKMLHFQKPHVSNYRKSYYFCKMKQSKGAGLTKQFKETKKIKGDALVGTGAVNRDIENPCVCESLVKKINDLKATGPKLSKELICVRDTKCACAKYLKKIYKNDAAQKSKQAKTLEANPCKRKQLLQKKHNITTPKLAQHQKPMNVMKNTNKYRGNSLKQAASVLSTAKLGMAVDDLLRSTKNKVEDHPATNYLNKYHPKDKKKKDPSDSSCSPYLGSLRKKPWLAFYYCCPLLWINSNGLKRRDKEVY